MRITERPAIRYASWILLGLTGAALQGCAQKPAAPAGPEPRLFASDFQGAAKQCSAPKIKLAPGKETPAAIKLGNDGGWCAINVADDGKPYATGLLTQPPEHGKVYIHPVGNDTRIDYTPELGFSGTDSFTVTLLPGSPEIKVVATVTPG